MLPPRSVFVARFCAGAFAMAVALSLWNGTTEWTAAFRGLLAATACALLIPPLYGPVEQAWAEGEEREAALSTAVPVKQGNARQ